MSTMKPDYFIGHNGLPNILLPRRYLITNECNRVSGDRQQIHLPNKNKSLLDTNQQANEKQCETEKNIKNRAIKESLRNSKSNKDLINAQISRNNFGWCRRNQNLSSPKCANADNVECNRNVKRCDRIELGELRDNKLTHQRKYDNTIFRHDLPDRLILPPLPI